MLSVSFLGISSFVIHRVVALRIELSAAVLSGPHGQPVLDYLKSAARVGVEPNLIGLKGR